MRISRLVTAVAAAAAVAAPTAVAQAAVVPGKVIVRFRSDSTHTERVAIQRRTGTRTDAPVIAGSRELEIDDGASVSATVARLRHHAKVAYAVPDYRVHAAFIPNDPGRAGVPGGWEQTQWNFLDSDAGVDAPDAWDLARAAGAPGGRGATVAVIDTGVAYENYHRFRRAPDLHGTRFVHGYDWVSHDRHPDDEEGHGTHVTGTIAQRTNNHRGLTGLAYGVRIMPLRVLDRQGNGTGSDIARAIRYAARHGADVINMSVEFDTSERARNIPDVLRAVRYAARKGVVMVAASGNEGISRVAYPARASHVISVGATTADGCLADYSNAGRGLDLVAPGGGQDTFLDGNAWDSAHCDPASRDRHIVQQTIWHGVRRFRLTGYDGTSFAAPHVSAAAAMLIASGRLGTHPTPAAVRRRLMDTAHDIGAPGYDRHYGAGLLDVAAALEP